MRTSYAAAAAWRAVQQGDVAEVRNIANREPWLLKLAHPSEKWTPLQLAVVQIGQRRGNPNIVPPEPAAARAVLGALLDALTASAAAERQELLVLCDTEKRTLLHLAASHWVPWSRELEDLGRRLIAAALAAGVSLEAACRHFGTPLHLAASSGSQFGRLLIEAGADVNALTRTLHQRTPLELALCSATDAAQMLLDHPLTRKTPAILWAVVDQLPDVNDLPGRLHLLSQVLARTGPQATDSAGQNCLFRAARSLAGFPCIGNETEHCLHVLREVASRAKDSGVDINHQDHEGNTVLHAFAQAAASHTNPEFVAGWVAAGVDPSIRNKAGRLPSEELAVGSRGNEKCNKSLRLALQQAELARQQARQQLASVSFMRWQQRQQQGAHTAELTAAAEARAQLSPLAAAAPGATAAAAASGQKRGGEPGFDFWAAPPAKRHQVEGKTGATGADGHAGLFSVWQPSAAATAAGHLQPQEQRRRQQRHATAAHQPASSPDDDGVGQPGVVGRLLAAAAAAFSSAPGPADVGSGSGAAATPAAATEPAAAQLAAAPATVALPAQAAGPQQQQQERAIPQLRLVGNQQRQEQGQEQQQVAGSQRQEMLSLLERCREAGELEHSTSALYRSAFNHMLTPQQRADDVANFAELAAAGELATLAACVRQTVAVMQRQQQQGVQPADPSRQLN